MEYKVGFKNGVVLRIQADSVHASAHSIISFRKGNDEDRDIYVSTADVLFIVPKERASIAHYAVGPSVTKSE